MWQMHVLRYHGCRHAATRLSQLTRGALEARTWRAAQLLQLLQQRALDALHLLLLVLVGPGLQIRGGLGVVWPGLQTHGTENRGF